MESLWMLYVVNRGGWWNTGGMGGDALNIWWLEEDLDVEIPKMGLNSKFQGSSGRTELGRRSDRRLSEAKKTLTDKQELKVCSGRRSSVWPAGATEELKVCSDRRGRDQWNFIFSPVFHGPSFIAWYCQLILNAWMLWDSLFKWVGWTVPEIHIQVTSYSLEKPQGL